MHHRDVCHTRGLHVLQGTFDTLALQELLGLLAHSRKTGALWLDAGPASAVVYVTEGLCFAVARADEGSFRFGSEEPPWLCSETVDLDVANDELARLLEEWREIQAV